MPPIPDSHRDLLDGMVATLATIWGFRRLRRAGLRDRVYGPELMLRLLRRAARARR